MGSVQLVQGGTLPKIVVTLDPGGTTGTCMASISPEYVLCTVGEGDYNEQQLRNYLTAVSPHYIVCETFEYRNKSRAGLVLTSRNLIGIVNLYVADNPSTRLFMQSPAQGKAFFTNDMLKKMELYPVGVQHGRDALRHFLRWFWFGFGAQYKVPGQTIELAK